MKEALEAEFRKGCHQYDVDAMKFERERAKGCGWRWCEGRMPSMIDPLGCDHVIRDNALRRNDNTKRDDACFTNH